MGKDQELIEAARNGDTAVVEKILNSRAKKGTFSSLRRGPGANAQDANGFTALHHAAANRHKPIVELLLSHEASPNIVDLQGSSPLHLAAWSGNEEIVQLLLTKGPSVPGPNVNLMNKSSETPIHMAAQFGHTEVVKLLLHHGADPVIINERHETALDLAAQYGRFETVQLLLKSHPELLIPFSCANANANSSRAQAIFPHTPLHLASRNGHRAVVEVLVKAGFEVNARTSNGTALHEAALCGKVDVVKALLESGIDVCVADSQRRTAVDRLSEVGLKTPVAKEIAELIRNALKKKHIQQGKSSSPHESGANNNNKDGKLPLSQIHDNHSHSEEPKLLLRHSPHHSPKGTPFSRGKSRRSLDVGMGKQGPDFEKPLLSGTGTGPPKKPPRRNLSASPTHPGPPDLCSCPLDQIPSMGRNKSLDGDVYSDRWRKSLTCNSDTYTNTSQSTESIDLSPPFPNNKGRVRDANCNGVKGDNQYVSVAHIRLKEAKDPDPEHYQYQNQYAVVKHAKPLGISEVKKPAPRGPKPSLPPKPKNIKNVLNKGGVEGEKKRSVKANSMCILSPVDVDKEWENIALFMDTYNDGEDPPRVYCASVVGKWLSTLGMGEYEELLTSSGFDDLKFLGDDVLDEGSLLEIGILNAQHRKIITSAAERLEVRWPRYPNHSLPPTVDQWLSDLHLSSYIPMFRKNLYNDPTRLSKLCNDELITLLEIDALGHRRRLLAAAGRLPSVNGSMSLSADELDLTDNEDDLKGDGSLPLRDPNHLVSGVSSALKTAWRHSPETLIDGSVSYRAIYVGSNQVHEFSTTDAIQKAIQEIRGKEGGTPLLLNAQVTLIVSASVVSWYSARTKTLIKEQDIRSIQCTCQASDDLRHLALVTRAPDPTDKAHSCHVFCLDSVEVATEAILTLGQAFEVAYQLALGNTRSVRDYKGHMRSKSANQLSSKAGPCSPNSKLKRDKCFSNLSANTHLRSQSVADLPPPPTLSPAHIEGSRVKEKLPRAESFSFSSNSHFTRAPIVSKEEL